MTQWVRADAVLWRASLDGALLLPPGSDDILALSETAARLWEVLAEPTDLAKAAEVLADGYDMDAAAVRTALAPVLSTLREAGAVRPA